MDTPTSQPPERRCDHDGSSQDPVFAIGDPVPALWARPGRGAIEPAAWLGDVGPDGEVRLVLNDGACVIVPAESIVLVLANDHPIRRAIDAAIDALEERLERVELDDGRIASVIGPVP